MGKKVAIITGASSGMGMETALVLLNRGFKVYCGARRTDRMLELEKLGAHIMRLDVTEETSMRAFVDFVSRSEGRIDVLINNAGYGACGAVEDVSMDEVRRQFAVNVFGLGRMTQLVLPLMRKQRFGRIVNVGSMGGHFTTPFGGWYHSTKYAVEAVSDALRMELMPFNIKVVVVDPGMINTDWGVIAAKNIRKYSGGTAYSENALRAARYYEQRYKTSGGRLTAPERVAAVIADAATVSRPKVRYLVGTGAKPFVAMKRLLSDELFQRLTLEFMGLKK